MARNIVLWRRMSGAVKRDSQPYTQRYNPTMVIPIRIFVRIGASHAAHIRILSNSM